VCVCMCEGVSTVAGVEYYNNILLFRTLETEILINSNGREKYYILLQYEKFNFIITIVSL